MSPKGQNTLLWFAHQEGSGPVATDQRLIRPFYIPVLGIALQNGTEFPESALHVAKSWVHLVRREPHHRVHAHACRDVVVLCKLPRFEILTL